MDKQEYGARTKERASFWRVSLRTMQKMLAEQPAWPVDDVVAMLQRVAAMPAASQAKLTRTFRTRVDELRMEMERGGDPSIVDPDYAEFLRTHGQSATRDSSLLADLKQQASFAVFKLQRAQARGNLPAVKDATETLRYISGVIHDEELRAQKLGREVGDILPRPEAERILRALVYWTLRGTHDFLDEICPRLASASASGPLFRDEVRQLVQPVALAARLLHPFKRATQINAGHALPAWCYATLAEAHAATLEEGEKLFRQLYNNPPPPPDSFADGAGI